MKFLFNGMIALTLLVSTISTAAATTVIDTVPAWNGGSFVFPFGETNVATFGQTMFVPDDDTVLDIFTFFVNDSVQELTNIIDFQAFVMAWDGSKATGPILFESSPLSTSNNGFEEFTIDTGGLSLLGGSEIVAFFSVSNLFDGMPGLAGVGFLPTDQVAGEFVAAFNGEDLGLLTTTDWFKFGDGSDLVFTASFSPVPEPGPLALLGFGLLGLGLARQRRR